MAKVLYNRNPLILGQRIPRPAARLISETPSLLDVSLEDAHAAGGPLLRTVLDAMPLGHDHRYIVVQVQSARLQRSEVPNGLGWHTDGVPAGPGRYLYATDDRTVRPHRFHLLVISQGCRTAFVEGPLELDDPETDDFRARRRSFTEQIARLRPPIQQVPSCQVVEYDWWHLHTSVPAMRDEWRLFVRVAETDHYPPRPLEPPRGEDRAAASSGKRR